VPLAVENDVIPLLRLVRIVEEKLVAIEIHDHQQPVAPVAVLDRNAAGLRTRQVNAAEQ